MFMLSTPMAGERRTGSTSVPQVANRHLQSRCRAPKEELADITLRILVCLFANSQRSFLYEHFMSFHRRRHLATHLRYAIHLHHLKT